MKRIAICLSSLALTLVLSSCFGLILDLFEPKPEFPGENPPSVVAAGAGSTYLTRNAYTLPPTQEELRTDLKMRGGYPVGLKSQWRGCVRSPYGNREELFTHKLRSGTLVTDPYERKQFYLP